MKRFILSLSGIFAVVAFFAGIYATIQIIDYMPKATFAYKFFLGTSIGLTAFFAVIWIAANIVINTILEK